MKKYQNCSNYDNGAWSCYNGRDCYDCSYYDPIDHGIFIDREEKRK
jgi:hypothetical protein